MGFVQVLKKVEDKTGLGRFAPDVKRSAAVAVQQLRDSPEEVLPCVLIPL